MKDHGCLTKTQRRLLGRGIIELKGDIVPETAYYVRDAITLLVASGSPDIEVWITSGGGDVDVGLDIYDMLRLYSGKVTGKVIGYARSMAVVILQACDQRQCARHARILIHHIRQVEVSLDTMRDRKAMAGLIKESEQIQQRISRILANRTGRSIAEIRRACVREYDMFAQEAKKFGLIDRII